ncbi:MAG: type II secretion system protein GspC [Spongiibacteraceae bacterium]
MPAAALTTAKTRLDNELRRLSPLAQRLGAVPPLRWRQLALVIACAWILANLARLVWLLLPLSAPPVAAVPIPVNAAISDRGAKAAHATTVDLDTLVGWHLFGEAGVTKPAAASAIETQAQDTSLNLQLVGLVQSSDDKLARAILLMDGRQQQFAIGEQLPASGKVVLSKVLADRAIIDNDGRYETLWLYDQETLNRLGGATQTTSTVPTRTTAVDLRVDKGVTDAASGYREQLYQNPSSLADLIQVSVQQDGFRIRPGRDPQAFAAFGLLPDDIVTAVNGVSLNNPEAALNLYNEMRTAQDATLTIRRGDEEVVIAVSLQGAAAGAQQ